jgi:hypothetical protein
MVAGGWRSPHDALHKLVAQPHVSNYLGSNGTSRFARRGTLSKEMEDGRDKASLRVVPVRRKWGPARYGGRVPSSDREPAEMPQAEALPEDTRCLVSADLCEG